MDALDRQILAVLQDSKGPLTDQAVARTTVRARHSVVLQRLTALCEQGLAADNGWRFFIITAAGLAELAKGQPPAGPTRAQWIIGLTFMLAMAAIGVLLLVVGE